MCKTYIAHKCSIHGKQNKWLPIHFYIYKNSSNFLVTILQLYFLFKDAYLNIEDYFSALRQSRSIATVSAHLRDYESSRMFQTGVWSVRTALAQTPRRKRLVVSSMGMDRLALRASRSTQTLVHLRAPKARGSWVRAIWVGQVPVWKIRDDS